MLAGLCLLLGGKQILKWAAPSIVFLFFMLPLPYRVEVGLRTPLQSLGTVASCYTLQTLGLPAYPEGNQIHGITEQPLEVEQACSGLGMMMVFFALCAAVVYFISDRPLWERAAVLISAPPIAIFANVLRISVTGTLYAWGFDRRGTYLARSTQRVSDDARRPRPVVAGTLVFLETRDRRRRRAHVSQTATPRPPVPVTITTFRFPPVAKPAATFRFSFLFRLLETHFENILHGLFICNAYSQTEPIRERGSRERHKWK